MRFLKGLFAATLALCITGSIFAWADYNATVPGSGTSFGGMSGPSSVQLPQSGGVTIQNEQDPTTCTAVTFNASVNMCGLLTFPVLYGPRFTGVLKSIVLKFKGSAQTVDFYVAIFTVSPSSSTFTNASAINIAAADVPNLVNIYHLTASIPANGTNSVTVYSLNGIDTAIGGASANLYAAVWPGATTAALGSTSDLELALGVSGG